MNNNKLYEYKFLSIDEQVEHLERDRNLKIVDVDIFKEYLAKYNYENFINLYYKVLSKSSTKIFLEGVTSNTIISLFDFDRKLGFRLLIDILELERILTTKIIYHLPKYFYDNKQKYSNGNKQIEADIDKFYKGEVLTLSDTTLLKMFPNIPNKNIKNFKKRITKFTPKNVLSTFPSIWKIAIYWTIGTLYYFFKLLDNDTKFYIINDFNFKKQIYPKQMDDILLLLDRIRNRACHNNMIYKFDFINISKANNNKIIFPLPLTKLIISFYGYKPTKIRMKQVCEIFKIFINTKLIEDINNYLSDLSKELDNNTHNSTNKEKIISRIKEYMRF